MAQKLNIDIVARDKSKQALNNVQGSLSRLKQSVFNLRNAFIGLGAGLVIRNLVNTGKELENLQVRLKFLLKDTNEGAKAFDNMVKFASKVPFSLEEIQRGSGILATVTDNADDLQKMLEITGNVAAVTGLDFRTTAEQIQRSFSAGIGAADLFREKGVRNMLGFQAGATVSIENTVAAFEKVFGKGGKFGTATDELANTFEGTMSMLGDKVFAFKKALLDAGFFAELKNQFGDLDKFLEEHAEQLEKIAIEIGTNLAQGTVAAAKGIKTLADNFRDLQSIIGILMIAFGGLTFKIGGIALIVNDVNRRLKELRGLANDTSKAIEKLYDPTTLIGQLGSQKEITKEVRKQINIFESHHKLTKAITDAEKRRTDRLIGANRNIFDEQQKIEQSVKEEATLLEQVRLKIRQQNDEFSVTDEVVKFINIGVDSLSRGLAESLILGKNIKETFSNMAKTLAVEVLSQLISVIAKKGVELAIEKMITNEKRKQIALSGGGSIFSAIGSFFGGKASGGAVAKGQPTLVGEQGAEMFIPNSTGQITQSARGTGNGGSTTVNFNINTVDARGFDELLTQSRGTIAQLINQAVNERGAKSII